MIGSHHFESFGGIYLRMGKGGLGKYQEKEIHIPLSGKRCFWDPHGGWNSETTCLFEHSHMTKSSIKPSTQGQA